MFNNPYMQQQNVERINEQIKQLENIKTQMQQPLQPITQNFQLAPNREMRYANSLEEVQKESVYTNTPFFSKDMSVLWVKNSTGDVKTYELKEIINKDEKDLKIEFLMAQIEDLKKGMKENAKSNNDNANEPIESKESTDVSNG